MSGSVTDRAGQPISDVSLSITPINSNVAQQLRTNREGQFRALFLDGAGTYTLLARKVGYAPAIVSVVRRSASNIVPSTVVLYPAPYPLAPLTVRTPRYNGSSRVELPSVGGASASILDGAYFSGDPSSVDSLIGLSPGIFAGDSGYSALGSPPDQNSVLLDGVTFDGSRLPPDAICGADVAITTSDPSRGRFAGTQTALSSCRGHDVTQGAIRGSYRDPILAWSDPEAITPPERMVTVSGYLSGPLDHGLAHYHWSSYVSDLERASRSLTGPSHDLDSSLGISADTLAAITSTLQRLGVPLGFGPNTLQSREVTSALTADWRPNATTSMLLTSNATIGKTSSPTGGLANLSPGRDQATSAHERVMLRTSMLVHSAVDELTATWSNSSTTANSGQPGPSGIVLVPAAASGAVADVIPVGFGGNAAVATTQSSQIDLINQLSGTVRSVHQLTFGQELTLNSFSQRSTAAAGGLFTYASAQALADDSASTYMRMLSATTPRADDIAGAAWLTERLRASHRLSLEGGLRVDASAAGPASPGNPVVDSEFAVRTGAIPSNAAFSPRLGFALLLKQRPPYETVVDGVRRSVVYADADMFQPGALRGDAGAGATLYGDIGAYRGVLSPNRIAQALGSNQTTTVTCVGSAIPDANWGAPSGPGACRNGADESLGAVQQRVFSFAPGFRPPTDWKANLGLNGLYWWKTWSADIAVLAKHGSNYLSQTDRNLAPLPAFTLRSERNRPVYAAPQQIVASTGAISASAGRPVPAYGAVESIVSDLHSDAAQLHLTLHSGFIARTLSMQFDYLLNLSHSEFRGFDASTAGDPFSIETARGTQPTQQFVLTSPTLRPGPVNVRLRLSVQSGTAYSPIVAGDINGDGLSNDRAYVFDPKTTTDPVLADGMRTLLADAPAGARRCLASQVGRIAAPNSCRGPWQARVDLNVGIGPAQGIGSGRRLTFSLQLLNAGAAAMRLLGISSALSAGSGLPDPRLLYVVGFDPASQSFRYNVNPAFGQGTYDAQLSRPYPPFKLQVGLQYAFGGPRTNPWLRSHGLTPSGRAYVAEQVRAVLRPMLQNPVDTVLGLRDSLLLSSTQITRLDSIAGRYRTALDSLSGGLVAYVIERGGRLTDLDILNRLSYALDQLTPLRNDAAAAVGAILSDAQRAKLNAILGRVAKI